MRMDVCVCNFCFGCAEMQPANVRYCRKRLLLRQTAPTTACPSARTLVTLGCGSPHGSAAAIRKQAHSLR